MEFSIDVIIAFLAGLVLLYLLGWALLTPLKLILKLLANGVLGGILLWILNILGTGIGVSIAINPITALIAGFLGVPGVILMLILQVILV